MKRFLWIAILIQMAGCMHYRNKRAYQFTVKKDSNLYIEVYHDGLIGNMTSDYLTDSTKFRIYLGTYDDEQGYIFYRLKGDSVIAEKMGYGTGLKFDKIVVIDSAIYNLIDLRKQHVFE